MPFLIAFALHDGGFSGRVGNRAWRLTVDGGPPDDICFELSVERMREEDGGRGCSSLDDSEVIGVVGVGRLVASEVSFAYGLASSRVDLVRVRTEGGDSYEAKPVNGRFAMVFRAPDEVDTVTAFGHGRKLASCKAFESCS